MRCGDATHTHLCDLAESRSGLRDDEKKSRYKKRRKIGVTRATMHIKAAVECVGRAADQNEF